MARKRYKAEEIVAKLRQVDVLTSQGTEHRRCDPPDRRDSPTAPLPDTARGALMRTKHHKGRLRRLYIVWSRVAP
jgi:hypothetical protein